MLIFLIARLTASQTCKSRTQLGLLHRNASPIFYYFSSVVKLSESNQPKQKLGGNEPFTVSYLMNSIGFSAKVASEVSKRVSLKDPENPISVVNLLRSYGFSDIQISKIVKKQPRLLLANPEKTLLPKLRFIQSIGFSCSELPELLISNTRLITRSLKKRLVPLYVALKTVLDDDAKVNAALKRTGWCCISQDITNIYPNIEVLRDLGVPQSSLSLLLTTLPNVAFMNPAKFAEIVKFVKETGIRPSKSTFVQAITTLAGMKKSTWDSKLDVFERFGWSRDVTLSAFSKYPPCMNLSEENITNSLKFLMDEMGLSSEDIAGCPAILGYSLKRRIIPRWSVVKILKMKGLFENKLSLPSIIIMSQKKFWEEFVMKFQESVPRILKIYEGEFRPLPEV